MKGIINAFEWLIDFFKSIFSFFSNFLKSIINLFDYLLAVIDIVKDVLATLPSWILPFFTISLAIIILFQILNRPQGRSKE